MRRSAAGTYRSAQPAGFFAHSLMKNLLFAIRAASALTCGVLITGCASNGYITSTVSTGLGLDVSENPQTQVPHVRFGYIRNGLYYIPTSKLGDATGDVTKTPNVVSKIHVATKFLQSITISEKFAVGKKAVLSGSAQQVFQDLSSERGPHSPIPSSDAPDLSAPPVPLPPRQTPKPRAGNKPAAPAADRDALVGEVISAIKKV